VSGIDDVLVVGGGVIGTAITESLAGEGLRVRLLEAEGVASGASGAAAGMLAPISEAHARGPMLDLGLESLARFDGLCARLKDETGIDPELERSGLFSVAAGAAEIEALRQRHRRLGASAVPASGAVRASGAMRASGAVRAADDALAPDDLEWIDATALRAELPSLAPDVSAGLYSAREKHLRPPLFARALEASARTRSAVIETGVRVQALLCADDRVIGVETSAGRRTAGAVVLAAGPWTPGLLEGLTVRLDLARPLEIEPVRGQILLLEPPLPTHRAILWGAGIYLVPKRDGSWIVGATEERVGFDRRVTAEGVGELLSRARRLVPELAEAGFGTAWAGLRPVSRDGLPWIGPLPGARGLYIAAGHGRNGVLLAPITAERIRDAVLDKTVSPPADRPFADGPTAVPTPS
jgi:glycine oxidase